MSYNVIVADPPWQYGFSRSKSRSVEAHYHSLTQEQICQMPVGSLKDYANGTLLVCWATFPKLELALTVIRSWGFRYVTGEPWNKVRMGTGYYNRLQHELILYAQDMLAPYPLPATPERSGIEGGWRGESVKPEALQDKLDRYYPNARKLELFARRLRPGWDVWGDDPAVAGQSIQWASKYLR